MQLGSEAGLSSSWRLDCELQERERRELSMSRRMECMSVKWCGNGQNFRSQSSKSTGAIGTWMKSLMESGSM